MEINVDIEIDLSGLQCPMPLLKAKLALNNMEVAQVLKVVATDPATEKVDSIVGVQTTQHIEVFQHD